MEIVVVGANGTIGSAAKKALDEKEHEVVSVGAARWRTRR